MTYTYFKNKIKPSIKGFKLLDDYLYYLGIKKANKGNKTILKDTRTFISKVDGEQLPHLEPIMVLDNKYYVVCPFCGEIHVHGAAAPGMRTAHCKDTLKHKDYIILDLKENKKNH